MGIVHIQSRGMRALRRLIPPFTDRFHAGRALAEFIKPESSRGAIVLGLPRGGVPVGLALAQELYAPLDVVVVRKLPIPGNPEMGFGAVAVDGSLILNHRVIEDFQITSTQIDAAVRSVRTEVSRRAELYRGGRPFPEVGGIDVYLVDDGLATGYTMLAAAKMVRTHGPRRLIIAVPVSPADSLESLKEHVEEAYCLLAQESGPFAVASFYVDFHDLSDREVMETLAAQEEFLRERENIQQFAVT
ncbi:MAG: phosphoribosyltransferase [Desulfomonile sp.]|nr:phosphoribosyltransferase [Desulfomonile sp.]